MVNPKDIFCKKRKMLSIELAVNLVNGELSCR